MPFDIFCDSLSPLLNIGDGPSKPENRCTNCVTGNLSKTDGLETSGSPSSGTFVGIFDGDTMPITTDDLAGLPLHRGVKFPTNFNFGEVANGRNASGCGQASTTITVHPSSELSRGEGAGPRDTRTGVIPELLHSPEDLFLWMSYAVLIGTGPTTTDSVPALATVATGIQPNADRHISPLIPPKPNGLEITDLPTLRRHSPDIFCHARADGGFVT